MRKIAYILLFFALAALTGCEKGLSDLNVNRTNPTSLDPVLLLNQAVINTSYPAKPLVFDIGVV